MKKYKAVFLDWDNTIGDFSRAAWKSLQEIYTACQLERFFPSFEAYHTVYHEYNLHLWDLYGAGEISKDELQRERFAYPLRTAQTGADAASRLTEAEICTMADRIGDDFCRLTTEYFTVLPHAAEVVRSLAERYPLTVVSNGFVEVQYEKINRSGLADCFKHIILSEEVGANKPDPRIFDIALQRNGVTAAEAVMIGDTYSSDIAGAIAAGIDQIWIQPADTDDNRPATYKVSDILQLKTLL